MNMKLKWCIRYFTCVIVTLLFVFACYVGKDAHASNYNEKYSIDTPYVYPVLPGTDQWKEMNSHLDKINACMIPEKI